MKGFEGAFPAHPGSDLGQYYADRPPTDRIANRFAAILARAAEAPTGLIHLIEGSERMTLAGASGLMAGWVMPEPVMVKSMVVGIVVSCGHPVMIADILDDPRVPEDALALKLGMRSYVGFPIRGDRQQTIGVCSVVDYQPREWSARELTAVDEAAQAYSEFLAAQRHSENQRRFLDTVLQNIAHGVVACDEDGRITFANSSIQRMYNVTSVGHSIWERAGRSPLADLDRRLISDDEMPLTRVLGGEVLRDIEYLVPDPDGSVRRVSIDAQPILGGDGRRQG
ncbi:GAF domain-containing protein, partial [Actinoplanes regularis]